MDKLKICILFGGSGEEHFVSVKSAREVDKYLDKEKYEVIYIGITQNGCWRLCNEPSENLDKTELPTAIISPDKSVHGIMILENGKIEEKRIDVVFPVLHGNGGEDGTIQGLLELSGIPYVGCGLQSSMACMDKAVCHLIANNAGINTPEFWVINSDDDIGEYEYPVFVKPARSGSSFGVSKVNNVQELMPAIITARQFDKKVLIEKAVFGKELGCAVLEDENGLHTGEIDQIDLSGGFFRIHQEKSPEKGSENSNIKVPADIDDETEEKIKLEAKRIFSVLGCRGISRIDMFLDESNKIILNEINTMPGLTSYSRYPQMMNAAGICFTEMIDKMINFAIM